MSDLGVPPQPGQPSDQPDPGVNYNMQPAPINPLMNPVPLYPAQPGMIPQYNYPPYYNYQYYVTPELMYKYQQEQMLQNSLESVQRCHLHTKPELNCKFCRKFKSSVHEISKIAQKKSSSSKEDKANQIPMTNSVTYNMNDLLRSNILSSEYYKSLSVKNFYQVFDELVQFATHSEPYCSTATRAPSTIFCCLYRFLVLKLTEKQMNFLLENVKSPYARCCGFLYLRYVLPPDKLWNWFEPYFLDDELFTVSADGTRKITMGEYVESLLMEDKYYHTILPRLPVRVKNLFGAHLLEMSQHRNRRVKNLDFVDDFVEGAQVSVCSKGDWLDGEILSVKEGRQGYPLVTVHLEDGNDETVDIGYVVLKGKDYDRKDKHKSSRKKDRSRSRSRTRTRSRSSSSSYRRRRRRERSSSRESHPRDDTHDSKSKKEDLIREFKRREREKALAVGKDYGKRPSSYKSSLSSRFHSKKY